MSNLSKPDHCRYHLDIAPAGRVTENPFTITGWFLDEQGRAARQIRVRIGSRVVICDRVDRPDLGAHFPQPALDAGFRWLIKTWPGLKYVVLEAETVSGNTVELYSRLLWMRSARAPLVCDYATWLAADTRVNPPAIPPENGPLISVLMPVFNPPERWLRRAIESVLNQTYPHWELCIANDASTHPAIRPLLDGYAVHDPRIKVVHRAENGHISAASNSALALSTGVFTALLDHDDELVPHALAEIVRLLINHPAAELVYSDEDKINEQGRRYDPYFKPGWNPDLLLGQNYFCHLTLYKTALLRALGGFRVGHEGAQDWDLALRAVERLRDDQIVHLPKILYHWRAIAGSTALRADKKNYHTDAAKKSLDDALRRRGWHAEVVPGPARQWRIRHALPDQPPLVSLIIPTRNRVEILRPCIESILKLTTYPRYEVLIVDNGSDDPATLAFLAELAARDPRVRVLRDDGPFNYSALNNRAAREARGELLALVNNDIEPITSGWLEEMVSHALRADIGAVGAMLYYPDDKIQHAGVVLGIAGPKRENGVAGHAFKGMARGYHGGMSRLLLAQNYSAVTAACLVVRKSIYEQVGGLNENHLAVSFNDVDFCLRVRKAGYRNLWTPFAELYHHESASRGTDNSPKKIIRAEREAAYMRTTWGPLLDNDPAYNPNLTFVHEDFSVSWPPRRVAARPDISGALDETPASDSNRATASLLSAVFDENFYRWQLKSASSLANVVIGNALAHYLDTGWRLGLNPHPFFDVRWYLAGNPDVVRTGAEPLVHYLRHGWKEDRQPHPRFDGTRYLARHPSLLLSATCPLAALARSPAPRPTPPIPLPSITSLPSHYLRDRPYPYLESTVAARIAAYRASRRTGNTIAFCTSITGGYDTLRLPEHLSPDIDYFLFTDRPETDGYGVFQVRPLEGPADNLTRASRHAKLQPHHCLAHYDIVVWCDANIIIRDDLGPLLRRFADSNLPVAFVPHPLRRCLYHEAVICALSGKDRTETIVAQMLAYQREGYPTDQGLIETGFFACRPQRPETRAFFDAWWGQLSRGSQRDQLSANYVLWKLGLPVFPLLGEGHNIRTHPATALLEHGTYDAGRLAALAATKQDPATP